jgi:iron-sulfur cluster assembly protein
VTEKSITDSRHPRPPKAILTLTEAAASHIQDLMAQRQKPTAGVRISLKTKGCTGMAYALTYVDEPMTADEVIQSQGVTVYVDPHAVLFLIGSEMDYRDDPIAPGFVFHNPNEKGRCGCGQSFHV